MHKIDPVENFQDAIFSYIPMYDGLGKGVDSGFEVLMRELRCSIYQLLITKFEPFRLKEMKKLNAVQYMRRTLMRRVLS